MTLAVAVPETGPAERKRVVPLTGATRVQPGNGIRVNVAELLLAKNAGKARAFVKTWERTGLVARTVFKIAEVVARRLVGSIPTRSRQQNAPATYVSAYILRGFAAHRAFRYTVYYTDRLRLSAADASIQMVERLRCCPSSPL